MPKGREAALQESYQSRYYKPERNKQESVIAVVLSSSLVPSYKQEVFELKVKKIGDWMQKENNR